MGVPPKTTEKCNFFGGFVICSERLAQLAPLIAAERQSVRPLKIPANNISLVDDIQLCAEEFVQQIQIILKERSAFVTDENKPIIANAIDTFIIKELKKVRNLLK